MYYNLINSMNKSAGYTARTTAFATATGITDATILGALNTFDLGLISNSLDTKMKAVYPFLGGTSATCKYNFMDARDLDAAFRLEFNGGWTFSNTGAKPNGANAYAKTFLIPNAQLIQNSNSYGFYSRTELNAEAYDMGTYTPPNAIAMLSRFGGSFYAMNNDGSYNASTNASSLGLLISSRTGANVKKGYRNNVEVQNSTTASVGMSTIDIWLGGLNTFGNGFSPRETALSFIGSGLNATEVSNFTTLVNNFQTSLSRNV